MSKVAILTDSNSGITQAQAEQMGVTVIPMPFFIDGVEYLEDINLSQEGSMKSSTMMQIYQHRAIYRNFAGLF